MEVDYIKKPTNYRMAFGPARIVVEATTPELPPANQLYDALKLKELSSGAIEVSLAGRRRRDRDGMQFVDRFELARQRWVWRNRPIRFDDRRCVFKPVAARSSTD